MTEEGPSSLSQKNARHAECEEDAAPWLPTNRACDTGTTGGPSSLPASHGRRRRYLSTYIFIRTDIRQGQSCRRVTSLAGRWGFSQGVEASP